MSDGATDDAADGAAGPVTDGATDGAADCVTDGVTDGANHVMTAPRLDGEAPPPPLHILPAPDRVPGVFALASLPLALLGAQFCGAVVAAAARWSFGEGAGETAAVLGGVLGGGAWLLLLSWLVPTGIRLPLGEALRLRPATPLVFGMAALGTFMLGPTADFLMSTVEAIAPDWTIGSIPRLQRLSREQPLWLLWPFFALLPGLAEELYFRGLVQNAFARPVHGLWVSALAFAAFHVDPHHVAGVLPLGLFLAWVGMRHGTVVTIFAHVSNNTVALLTARSPELDVGYGTGRAMPLYWVPLSLCFVALAVAVLRRNQPDG